MKKVNYPNLNDYDLSAYEELKGDILYMINGGEEIENTNDAVANAEVGDILIRDDGTEVVIKQSDIDYAREHGGTVNENNSTENNSNSNSGSNSGTTNNTTNNSSSNSGGSTDGGTTTTTTSGNNPYEGRKTSLTPAEQAEMAKKDSLASGIMPNTLSAEQKKIEWSPLDGKPINGCEIECTQNNTVIRVSGNDRRAMKEAEDKFLTYTNEGISCRVEVYTSNGSTRNFYKYTDFYDEMHPKGDPIIIDEAIYKNDYIRVGSVTGGFNTNSTTPWEIEASALEFNSSLNWEKVDIKSSTQLLNVEGNISCGSISNPGLSIAAKASALDLEWEASFHLGKYSISITPEAYLGSIGMEAAFAPNKVEFGLALGVGAGVGVNWNKE